MVSGQTSEKVVITRVRYILSTRDLNRYVDVYEGRETSKKILNLVPRKKDPLDDRRTIKPISKELLGQPTTILNTDSWIGVVCSFRGEDDLDLACAHQACLNFLIEETNKRFHKINALKSQIESFCQTNSIQDDEP